MGAGSGLISRVPAQPSTDGPPWLVELRQRAVAHLQKVGFPSKRTESWRFTSVRSVVDTEFKEEGFEEESASDETARSFAREQLGTEDACGVVLQNGRPALFGTLPAGVRVALLSELLASEPELVEATLGKLTLGEHFAALNGALFSDGVALILERGAVLESPIHVLHVGAVNDGPTASYPRLVVIANESSQGTLIESFVGRDGRSQKHLTNAVAEVRVGPNARLEHIRVTNGAELEHRLAYLAVELDRDAFYGSRVVTLGGALSRLEITLRFTGPGAECELDGVYHADGDEHVDHQIRVEHAAGRCTSHVRYRGLMAGRGHGVWNAIGIIKKDAQQSSTHQENKNLLLSPDATIDTKPHLEIDADDIKASHGATVGALDLTQLFYLRSRGIGEADAREILTVAFVQALLDRIPHEPTVTRASEAVLTRLGRAREELV